MFQHPGNDDGSDGIDSLISPYGVRVAGQERRRLRRWRFWAKLLGPLLGIGMVAVAAWVLPHILEKVKFDNVVAALNETSILSVMAALLLISLSYCCLIFYDLMALNHLGKKLSLAAVAVGGFVSFAVANSLGFVLLTAGSVRYRVYSPANVTAADVAVITLMSGLTFALSAMLIIGFCLLLGPQSASLIDGLPSWLNLLFGTFIIAALGGYVGWVSSGRKAVTWSGYEISLPGPVSTLALLASGVGDMVCASAALYLLLPVDPGTGYPVFLGLFAAAITLGLLSYVPGGIGVFESIMLFAVPNVPLDRMLASLLVFRVLYYLVPLAVAIIVYIWYEAAQSPISARIAAAGRAIGDGASASIGWVKATYARIEQEFRKRPGSF